MEVDALDMALQALEILGDPSRLGFLILGVLVGLAIGVIPGLGGLVGMALLLPYTYLMDPYAAIAMLLGMSAVTVTSDTIPAVLFGVPGTVGSAATILDGHPMAKRGQAGRAFGAAFSASLIGGLFGAVLLAISIPILRPLILSIGSPELVAITVFGLSMVASLSGGTPLRGLALAGFGLMLGMIGAAPIATETRWTFGTLYLWDGLPLVPVALGLFAIPELADQAIARRTIANPASFQAKGQWQGVRDTFSNLWLVFRCSWLGAALGAIPGLGAAVIDWIAYGHAARTEKGASETFGKGDVRGVLASEASNNAKEGGALVPTIAFGIPGSASMALLLGAFLIHGLVPGPEMVGKRLDVTYSMVWSVAIANIFGAGICFAFAGAFARIALIRPAIILPIVLAIIYVGAFQGARSWGDFYSLMLFGAIGWTMKRLQWPRPPLLLGFVLGGLLERYLYISVSRFGADWLLNPIVIGLLVLAAWGLARPLIRHVRSLGRSEDGRSLLRIQPKFDGSTLLYLALIAVIGWMMMEAYDWGPEARTVPVIIGWFAVVVLTTSLLNHFLGLVAVRGGTGSRAAHLDIVADDSGIEPRAVATRALRFALWMIGFVAMTAVIGLLPSVFLLVLLYMRVEGGERWPLSLIVAGGCCALSILLFDQVLALPWPHSLFGDWIPALRQTIPSV